MIQHVETLCGQYNIRQTYNGVWVDGRTGVPFDYVNPGKVGPKIVTSRQVIKVLK